MATAPSSDEKPEGERRGAISVVDHRSGKKYEFAITDGTISAVDFRALKTSDDDFGLMVFDPGYMNTAIARSCVSYIDGDRGILRYRGYPIEELATKSNFLECAHLVIFGELPGRQQLKAWSDSVMRHTYVHEDMVQLLKTFRYDAHPMGILVSSIAAMSTFHPEANPSLVGANLYRDPRMRNKQIFRILGKVPTLAACAYRHRIGRPYNAPLNTLNYTENFLYMLDCLSDVEYRPHPALARILDVMFILHIDHEMNNSTAAMRHVSSTLVDPYSAVAAAAGALYGPLHGGASEGALRMLDEIGTVANIPQFIDDVKQKKRRLMGFGHRVYKSYDPRAAVMKPLCKQVGELLGSDPLWEVAVELERVATSDPYFLERKLYPNVDFYSGLIYRALGFPTDMFPVLFAIPRVAGWLAHWLESLDDKEFRIARPRQVYVGHDLRSYIPPHARDPGVGAHDMEAFKSQATKRRELGEFYVTTTPRSMRVDSQ
eukprot:TRINITY_DN229_c0_g1_i1.p1 TRINITY_DN229_c0_g1~~TRINITY_DN229_c0_g1_i1.p1  ORF type:complete len:500 (-),score=103.25 TRINITY_DN229_c0_g1_i1:587-2050(-)